MPANAKAPQKKIVKAPFHQGKPVDRRSIQEGMKFTTGLLIMALLFLLLGTILLWDNAFLRIGANTLVLLLTCYLFLSSGMSAGAAAVTAGEIMYQRLQSGKDVPEQEKTLPYHPLKGWMNALIGTLPLLIAAIILAIIAVKQSTGIGALPNWVAAYQGRPEVGAAIQYYFIPPATSLEGVLRIIIRLVLMPFSSMVGSTNYEGMLLLERMSPLLVLFPALSYGLGYFRGVKVRDQIHRDIASDRRKRIRRERKQQAARREKKPASLN